MNNKPVAWMNAHTGHLCSGGFLVSKMQDYIPLYTHPAKTPTLVLDGNRVYPAFKELTDEEIMVLYEEYIETQYASESNVLGFGRAILRKAQEK
jgi:hypothetical protein